MLRFIGGTDPVTQLVSSLKPSPPIVRWRYTSSLAVKQRIIKHTYPVDSNLLISDLMMLLKALKMTRDVQGWLDSELAYRRETFRRRKALMVCSSFQTKMHIQNFNDQNFSIAWSVLRQVQKKISEQSCWLEILGTSLHDWYLKTCAFSKYLKLLLWQLSTFSFICSIGEITICGKLFEYAGTSIKISNEREPRIQNQWVD